tara:strand:+ start:246 stop:422 length:177 start_codon:yes stop_codon:yes gene_type:complete
VRLFYYLKRNNTKLPPEPKPPEPEPQKTTLNQYQPKKRQKKSIKKILFLKKIKKMLVY